LIDMSLYLGTQESVLATVIGVLIILGVILRVSWSVYYSKDDRDYDSQYDQTLIIENEPPNLRRLLKYRKY